ncbi:zinc finger, CCHC-type containing protein [Tanacetum coccineum]
MGDPTKVTHRVDEVTNSTSNVGMNIEQNSDTIHGSNTLDISCGKPNGGSSDLAKQLILVSSNDVIKGNVLIVNTKGPVLFAKLVTDEPCRIFINFCPLIAPAGNGADVAISMESVRVFHERLSNAVYGFFLGKHMDYPVVENYVKNTWSKYDLIKSMMTTKGMFFFKFSSKDGMDAMIENGPWLIYNVPLILKKWTPDANIIKEDNSSDARVERHSRGCCLLNFLWVMLIQFGEGLFGHVLDECPKKIVLDVLKNLRKPSQALAEKEANSDVVSSAHGTSSEAFGSPKITPLVARINDIERQILDGKLVLVYDDGKPLKPTVDDPLDADSDSEVDEVFNETASFMASSSSKINKSSKSSSGVGNKSLYEQWK